MTFKSDRDNSFFSIVTGSRAFAVSRELSSKLSCVNKKMSRAACQKMSRAIVTGTLLKIVTGKQRNVTGSLSENVMDNCNGHFFIFKFVTGTLKNATGSFLWKSVIAWTLGGVWALHSSISVPGDVFFHWLPKLRKAKKTHPSCCAKTPNILI